MHNSTTFTNRIFILLIIPLLIGCSAKKQVALLTKLQPAKQEAIQSDGANESYSVSYTRSSQRGLQASLAEKKAEPFIEPATNRQEQSFYAIPRNQNDGFALSDAMSAQPQTSTIQSDINVEEKKTTFNLLGEIELLLLVIIAILLPPLAVFLVDGLSLSFWLNLVLTLLFYIPGLIHALIVVFRK